MSGPAPSENFRGQVGTVIDVLRRDHPDDRVREWLSGETVIVYGRPGPQERMLAGLRGQQLEPDDLLLALHLGTPDVPQPKHRIMLFEDGVREAAKLRGVSVSQQTQESLLHELEHHGGYCPPGHTDCSPAEVAATLAGGGTLDPGQMRSTVQLANAQGHTWCGCSRH